MPIYHIYKENNEKQYSGIQNTFFFPVQNHETPGSEMEKRARPRDF